MKEVQRLHVVEGNIAIKNGLDPGSYGLGHANQGPREFVAIIGRSFKYGAYEVIWEVAESESREVVGQRAHSRVVGTKEALGSMVARMVKRKCAERKCVG